MASKRKRKLEKKSSKDFKDKMQARRASANDALWTYGLPLAVILVVGLGVYFAFFYEMGDPRAEEWELEDPQSGEVYASEDYYNNRLTIVEFFNSKCGACQTQAPILNDVHANYSSQVDMFAIGGYKLGSGQDSGSSIANFKVEYNMQFPHLYDPSGDLMRENCILYSTLKSFIKNGEIVYSHSGILSESRLAAEIEKYLE